MNHNKNMSAYISGLPSRNSPDLYYSLMRLADQLVPFDSPEETSYVFTMQAKYALIGLSLYVLDETGEDVPISKILEILKDEEQLLHAYQTLQTKEINCSYVVRAMEEISAGTREGETTKATLIWNLSKSVHAPY